MREIYRGYEIISENGDFGFNSKYGLKGSKKYESCVMNQKTAGDAIIMTKFRVDYEISKKEGSNV